MVTYLLGEGEHTYEISLWLHYILGISIVVFSLNTTMGFDVAVADVAVVVVHVLSTPDTRLSVI